MRREGRLAAAALAALSLAACTKTVEAPHLTASDFTTTTIDFSDDGALDELVITTTFEKSQAEICAAVRKVLDTGIDRETVINLSLDAFKDGYEDVTPAGLAHLRELIEERCL